jgi:hypothetical protein
MIRLDDVTEVTEVTPDLAPHRSNGHLPPNLGGGSEGGVSRETSTSGQPVKVNPNQAAQAYEANQKAVNVSRETLTAEEARINKEIPKGE